MNTRQEDFLKVVDANHVGVSRQTCSAKWRSEPCPVFVACLSRNRADRCRHQSPGANCNQADSHETGSGHSRAPRSCRRSHARWESQHHGAARPAAGGGTPDSFCEGRQVRAFRSRCGHGMARRLHSGSASVREPLRIISLWSSCTAVAVSCLKSDQTPSNSSLGCFARPTRAWGGSMITPTRRRCAPSRQVSDSTVVGGGQ